MWASAEVVGALSTLGLGVVAGAYRLGMVVGQNKERSRDTDRRLDRMEHREGYWNDPDHPGRRKED